MGNPQNCSFIEATLCPGYTGEPAAVWVNKAVLDGRNLGTGGSFAYENLCYSVPANAQPSRPPTDAVFAGVVGSLQANCAACSCEEPVSSTAIYFDCTGASYTTPSGVPLTVYGSPGTNFTLTPSAAWIGIGASQNTAPTLGAAYSGTFGSGGAATVYVFSDYTGTVNASGDITLTPCPATVAVEAVCACPVPSETLRGTYTCTAPSSCFQNCVSCQEAFQVSGATDLGPFSSGGTQYCGPSGIVLCATAAGLYLLPECIDGSVGIWVQVYNYAGAYFYSVFVNFGECNCGFAGCADSIPFSMNPSFTVEVTGLAGVTCSGQSIGLVSIS